MFEVNTLNQISPVGLDNFDRTKYKLSKETNNPDAIIVRSASMHDIEFGNRLKAIARAGAGVNNIPIDKCSNSGVVVFNTPGANANAVKELVILSLLISSRKVVDSIEWVKSIRDSGDELSDKIEKGKAQFIGPEILGKKIGVVGLGAIGVLVANAAKSLGMIVYGYDPYISVDGAWGLSSSVIHASSLKDIYENCDYITLHVPFNNETDGFVNSSSILMMKNGVRILNFSRGELVNEQDILNALNENHVKSYLTDFPTESMINHKGVVAFPHLGASTPESEDNCAYMATMQIIDYLENGNIKNSVNLPDASMTRTGKTRICIVHKNIKSMISSLSRVLSNVNIENMINKSKGDYAYTMIDIDDKLEETEIIELEKIDGIILVRVL